VHGTRYATREKAKADIFEYIEAFYNRKRLHSTLGYVSPQTYLQNWISSQHGSELAA
jgi:putative transposase